MTWSSCAQSFAHKATVRDQYHAHRNIFAGGVDVQMLEEAVALVGGRLETEASGNVTLSSVRRIAQTGVTFISCGALTHSVTAMDISLKISLV